MKLGISGTDQELWFGVELDHVLRKFNSPSTLQPIVQKVDVCDRKFKIPKGMFQMKGIRLKLNDEENEDSSEGQVTQPAYIPLIFYSSTFPYFASQYCMESVLTISNGYGHLNISCSDEVECCFISYIGYHQDDHGNILIYENYENCLASYLCYMFLLQNPHYYTEAWVTKEIRTEYYQTYLAEKKFIKGSEKKIEFDQERLKLALTLDRIKINNFSNSYNIITG